MERRDQVVRFEGRWLKGNPEQVLARIDMKRIKALAHQHGCWVQTWCNPCASMEQGVLFWLETSASTPKNSQSFQFAMWQDCELKKWFQSTE